MNIDLFPSVGLFLEVNFLEVCSLGQSEEHFYGVAASHFKRFVSVSNANSNKIIANILKCLSCNCYYYKGLISVNFLVSQKP